MAGPGGHGTGPGMMGSFGGEAYVGLELSPEQRNKIAEIQQATAKEQWQLMGAMHEQGYRMHGIAGPGAFDEAAARKSFDAMTETRKAMFEMQVEARKKRRRGADAATARAAASIRGAPTDSARRANRRAASAAPRRSAPRAARLTARLRTPSPRRCQHVLTAASKSRDPSATASCFRVVTPGRREPAGIGDTHLRSPSWPARCSPPPTSR